MRDATGRDGKTAAGESTPTSVSRFALENGVDYYAAMSFMRGRGLLDSDDQRCRVATSFADTPLAGTSKTFLAEVDHYHRKVREQADALPAGAGKCEMKGTIALQKKLIHATRMTGDDAGFTAGALAMSFEDAGLAVQEQLGGRRLARRLFEVSASMTDRVVLSERCASYQGLASETACKSGRSLEDTLTDLSRLGKINRDDPRLASNGAPQLQAYTSKEFSAHLKARLWEGIPKLQRYSDSPYSRTNIVKHVGNLPGRGSQPGSQVELDQRDAAFMASVAMLSERVAMNLALTGGGDKEDIAGLLAISSSACQRHQAYASRAREATREATRASPAVARTRRQDDMTL